LDQDEIERQLAIGTNQAYSIAKSIYEEGAFSKSVASVTLSAALTAPISKGASVIGQAGGVEVRGTVFDDYPANTLAIQVQYDVNSVQSSYVGCQVGSNPNPNTELCKWNP
jgi:hypothetical protein